MVNYEDTFLHTFSEYLPNVKYMSDKIVMDGSHSLYLRDYSRGDELPTPDNKVDLMVGHLTIGNKLFKGQSIDKSKFDVGFFGDIHSIIDDDNVHSISAPLQVKIDEINYGKAVIYDTTTKLWTREVIDERGELSKFKYTNDKSKHGPDLTTNTYYQYLPERSKSLSETQEAPDWTLIDDLVTKVMEKYELNGLHELIKSKVIFNPINFEFKLSRIKINNFKSLKNFEYDFNDSKVQLLLGHNGSGKSSFLESIIIGLTGHRSLNDFRTIGSESPCRIELELIYNKEIYTIVRNSNSADELFIGGIPQTYAKKLDVQPDIVKHLPFISYLDSVVLDSSVTKLLGKINSARRIDILSKHYRLDILNEYRVVCEDLRSHLLNDYETSKNTLISLNAKLEYLKERHLNLINEDSKRLSDEELDSLKSDIELNKSLLSNFNKLKDLETSLNSSKSLLNSIQLEINDLIDEKSKLGDFVKVDEDSIPKLNAELKKISDLEIKLIQLTELGKSSASEVKRLTNELDQLNGTELTKCSSCGQEVHDESLARLKSSIENKLSSKNLEVEKLRNSYHELNSELSLMDKKSISDKLNELNNIIKSNSELKFKSEFIDKSIESKSSKLSDITKDIDKFNSEISELGKIDIINPELIINKITELNEKIDYENNLRSIEGDIVKINDQISGEDRKFKELEKENDIYSKYIDLMKSDGLIFTEILNRLTENFTNDNFEFKTLSSKKNGKLYSDLSVKYNVDGKYYLDYELLSSGQKTLCDIYFLFRTILSSGVLIFDEFLKYLDGDNINIAIDMLKLMNVNNLIISTHTDNFNLPGDRLNFKLNNGESVII
jgi:energy-coupling factor transporter ATP-binding protein EcfA2